MVMINATVDDASWLMTTMLVREGGGWGGRGGWKG